MIHGLALSAGGAMASQHRMAVLSNNLANVGTVGFKRDLATFRVAPLEADIRGLGSAFRHPVADGIGGGIFAQPTFTDLKTGPIRNTQSPNDLAIAGEGFFQVDTAGGIRLTRDGRLTVTADGQLVRATSGEPLLDTDGEPITIDPAKPMKIDKNGFVRQNGDEIARLAVVTADSKAVRKAGNGLFRVSGKAQTKTVESPMIRQGYLEDSGVEPTSELTSLIQASRTYEINVRMLQQQDRTLGQLINTVARSR